GVGGDVLHLALFHLPRQLPRRRGRGSRRGSTRRRAKPMSHHTLQGRTEDEVQWTRRRSFLQAAAAWAAMGGFGSAVAQQRSNVVDLRGDAFVNGQKLQQGQFIQTGDSVETGPDGHLVFVMGNSAFLVRQNSRLTVERGDTLFAVSVLRLLTGAIVSVWKK